MSSYATADSAGKLCADDCLYEMHVFQSLGIKKAQISKGSSVSCSRWSL